MIIVSCCDIYTHWCAHQTFASLEVFDGVYIYEKPHSIHARSAMETACATKHTSQEVELLKCFCGDLKTFPDNSNNDGDHIILWCVALPDYIRHKM